MQIIVRGTFNPLTLNGGTADMKGGEIELTWAPNERWFVTASAGYIDAEDNKLSDGVLNNATPVPPYYKFVNTPEWSSALGVAYTYDLQDWAT